MFSGMAKKGGNIRVGFIALGCPKAIVDSEKMLGQIGQKGLVITADAEQADVIVVNTCGFIAPAQQEALEAIEYAVSLKKSGSVKKVIATGCLPQRLKEELFEKAKGLDAIVGLDCRDEISDIIEETFEAKEKKSYLESSGQEASDEQSRLLITLAHSAYLRISEGCDHKCSFCTIPAIRGRFRSKEQDSIIAEAKELAAAGAVELSIIAQDTCYYGKDMGVKNGLATLLGELEKIEELKWIRLMYMYPVGFTERLIEQIAQSSKIVNYLDMPIQHINNDILKKMRRADTKEKIAELIERLRNKIPDVVLRTTVIVGFPGETDEQFGELVEFIKEVKFDALGAFKYYREEGTDAAKMENQIPDDIKERRLDELMITQQEIAFEKNEQRIGREIVCLVDSFDEQGAAQGRFYGQAPDIDSVCIIPNCTAQPGEFVKAKVTDTQDYDLIAEQI